MRDAINAIMARNTVFKWSVDIECTVFSVNMDRQLVCGMIYYAERPETLNLIRPVFFIGKIEN